jgi:hypothetical protein
VEAEAARIVAAAGRKLTGKELGGQLGASERTGRRLLAKVGGRHAA